MLVPSSEISLPSHCQVVENIHECRHLRIGTDADDALALLALLGIGMGVTAGVTALITDHWPGAAIVLAAAAFGATAVGWNGIYLAEVVRVTSPERSAVATGGVLFFTFAGMMTGPAVFAAIVSAGGSLRVAFWVLAAFCLLPGLLLLRGRPGVAGAPPASESGGHPPVPPPGGGG